MAVYSSIITLGGHTLYIRSMTPRKVNATKKQIFGKKIIRVDIPGLDAWEWELDIEGVIFDDGTSLSTHRTNIEGLQDASTHALIDGLHGSNYYVTDLSFGDSGETKLFYTYRMSLVQS